MRRAAALPPLAVRGCIAAARLDPQRQAHFLHRSQQVTLHIMRQRLQRRHIKRVKAILRRFTCQPAGAEIGQRRKKTGQRFSGPGVRGEQAMMPAGIQRQHRKLMIADAPPPPGKPAGDFGRDGSVSHDRGMIPRHQPGVNAPRFPRVRGPRARVVRQSARAGVPARPGSRFPRARPARPACWRRAAATSHPRSSPAPRQSR